jgi:hypothetical protein
MSAIMYQAFVSNNPMVNDKQGGRLVSNVTFITVRSVP